jgi:hypothetical protein
MKDDFKYTFTTDDNAQQEEEYEKMLEKDIESQCVYVDKLEIVNEFTDEELRSTKSVDEVIEYKNAQIIKLKAYIASLEQEKQDLINNYKKTTDQLLDKVKEYEYKHLTYYHSISFNPLFLRNSFVRENGLLSKKPYLTESGDGCAEVITKCFELVIYFIFPLAKFPHNINTTDSSFSFNFIITLSVNCSHPTNL